MIDGTRDARLKKLAADLGLEVGEEIRALPHYEMAIEHGGHLFVSGQIPRIRGAVAVTGRVGAEVSLEEGRRAARICVVRALVVARQSLRSLHRVAVVLRMNVYVQSAPHFTEHSEVANAASEILDALFAPEGGHTRTTVGVYQLPQNAAVEIDLQLALHEGEPGPSTF